MIPANAKLSGLSDEHSTSYMFTIRKTNSASDLNKLCRISGAMPKHILITYLCDVSTASMPKGLSGSSGSVMPDQYWTESSITRQT